MQQTGTAALMVLTPSMTALAHQPAMALVLTTMASEQMVLMVLVPMDSVVMASVATTILQQREVQETGVDAAIT